MKHSKPLLAPMVLTLALAGCNSMPAASPTTAGSLDTIQNVVVIFAENRAFDNLYGLFPGANGIPGVNPSSRGAYIPQKDFDGSVLPVLPPTWGGLTVAGQRVTLSQAQTMGWPNRPFQLDDPTGVQGSGTVIGQDVTTRDLVHRFYNNQMQINVVPTTSLPLTPMLAV